MCCGKWFSLNLAKGVAVIVTVVASCPCQSALTEIEKYNNLVAKCHLRPTRRLGGMLWFSPTTNSHPLFHSLYTSSFSCCHFKSNAKCKSVWVAADLCLCQSVPSRRRRGRGTSSWVRQVTAVNRGQNKFKVSKIQATRGGTDKAGREASGKVLRACNGNWVGATLLLYFIRDK